MATPDYVISDFLFCFWYECVSCVWVGCGRCFHDLDPVSSGSVAEFVYKGGPYALPVSGLAPRGNGTAVDNKIRHFCTRAGCGVWPVEGCGPALVYWYGVR